MSSVRKLILFNPPAGGLESLGILLPRRVAVIRHVAAAETVEFLRQGPKGAALGLWAAPTAEAEQAATDLIDVLARRTGGRPVLVAVDSYEPEAGTAIAEVMCLPWTHRLDCSVSGVDRANGLERFFASVIPAETSPVPAPHTLSRLWGAALRCYRHDRANTLRRLLQYGSGDDLAAARRYLFEHGEFIIERVAALDRGLLDAAEWYLSAETRVSTSIDSTLAGRRGSFSQLVQGMEGTALRSFLESEARFGEELATAWPRLSRGEAS